MTPPPVVEPLVARPLEGAGPRMGLAAVRVGALDDEELFVRIVGGLLALGYTDIGLYYPAHRRPYLVYQFIFH